MTVHTPNLIFSLTYSHFLFSLHLSYLTVVRIFVGELGQKEPGNLLISCPSFEEYQWIDLLHAPGP